jgi:hypothetical protein
MIAPIFKKLVKFCIQKNIQIKKIENFFFLTSISSLCFLTFFLTIFYTYRLTPFLLGYILWTFLIMVISVIYSSYFLPAYWNEDRKNNLQFYQNNIRQNQEKELALSIHQSKF